MTFSQYSSIKKADITLDQYDVQSTIARLSEIKEQNSTANRDCQLFFHILKETSDFQKSYISKNSNVIIPRSNELERCKSQGYKNYQKMRVYTIRKTQGEQIHKKYGSKVNKNHKLINLKRIVELKKIKMLSEQNKTHLNEIDVERILKSDRQRKNLFTQTILIERFLSTKKQEMITNQPTKKRNKDFSIIDDINSSKHFHLNQIHTDLNVFYRRRFTKKNQIFQQQNKLINFQISKIHKKQQQNRLIIKNVMKYYSNQIQNQHQKQSQIINKSIHRLFLKYACCSIEQGLMYKYINCDQLKTFFIDFQLEYRDNQKVRQIANKKTIDFSAFSEIIYLLSLKDNSKFETDVMSFLEKHIFSRPNIYVPKECLLFQTNREFIENHLKQRKYYHKLQLICILKNICKSKQKKLLYTFDELVGILLVLKIYPYNIEKTKLKFYFLYSQSVQQRIKLKDIGQIIIYIALNQEGDVEKNIKDIVKRVVNCKILE